ncbi:S8 family serine peptidase, partial [Streptococcus salivarius]|uniref:S8 family serine peptidase n=1 Tax=Streptococcus salivarius TaxID=1304 RepID=UPI001D071D8E
AGLDDAVKLGADAVNLSLGSPAGSTEYGDEDEEETDGYLTYSGVYTRAEEAGINVMIAAGNETSSTYYNPSGTQLTLA